MVKEMPISLWHQVLGRNVPLNIVTQLNEAHANELIQIRRTHAQQVETLKLTMATLQEKLIRRGRELAKLRHSKENFKKRFEPAALFGKSGKTVSTDTSMKNKKKKKVKAKKPASKRKSGTSVKFSSETGFDDMSDVVTPWSVKEGASSRPETTISMSISRASTSEGHGNNGAQQHKISKKRHANRPNTANTVTHQAPFYYLSPVDRAITDAALKEPSHEVGGCSSYAEDVDAPGKPLRLPANFMPLAPPRLASQASQSNALREQHDRLLGVRRNAHANSLPRRPATSDAGRQMNILSRKSRQLKMNQIDLLRRPGGYS